MDAQKYFPLFTENAYIFMKLLGGAAWVLALK